MGTGRTIGYQSFFALGTIQSNFYWVGHPPLKIGTEMVGNNVILPILE